MTYVLWLRMWRCRLHALVSWIISTGMYNIKGKLTRTLILNKSLRYERLWTRDRDKIIYESYNISNASSRNDDRTLLYIKRDRSHLEPSW